MESHANVPRRVSLINTFNRVDLLSCMFVNFDVRGRSSQTAAAAAAAPADRARNRCAAGKRPPTGNESGSTGETKKLEPFPFSDLKKKESLLIERFWELWCPNGQFEQPEFLRTASMIMDEFS